MNEFDINRLKEAIAFLKEGEKFVIVFDDVAVTLEQGKRWLYIGMRSRSAQYYHGINLDDAMQKKEGNLEYWIFKIYKQVKEYINE